MYLELIAPILSLFILVRFEVKDQAREKEINALQEKIELMQADIPKKVMTTMIPVAKAVQKLNEQVGL